MAKEKKKGIIGEFKEFIMRGNVMDMAVAVIVGGAFQKIITSLTNDIIMPLITCFSKKFLQESRICRVVEFHKLSPVFKLLRRYSLIFFHIQSMLCLML